MGGRVRGVAKAGAGGGGRRRRRRRAGRRPAAAAVKTGKVAEMGAAAAAAASMVAMAAATATGGAATATAAAWGREHAEAVVALVNLVDGWVWELLPAQKKRGGQIIIASISFLRSPQLSNDCTCTGSLLQ